MPKAKKDPRESVDKLLSLQIKTQQEIASRHIKLRAISDSLSRSNVAETGKTNQEIEAEKIKKELDEQGDLLSRIQRQLDRLNDTSEKNSQSNLEQLKVVEKQVKQGDYTRKALEEIKYKNTSKALSDVSEKIETSGSTIADALNDIKDFSVRQSIFSEQVLPMILDRSNSIKSEIEAAEFVDGREALIQVTDNTNDILGDLKDISKLSNSEAKVIVSRLESNIDAIHANGLEKSPYGKMLISHLEGVKSAVKENSSLSKTSSQRFVGILGKLGKVFAPMFAEIQAIIADNPLLAMLIEEGKTRLAQWWQERKEAKLTIKKDFETVGYLRKISSTLSSAFGSGQLGGGEQNAGQVFADSLNEGTQGPVARPQQAARSSIKEKLLLGKNKLVSWIKAPVDAIRNGLSKIKNTISTGISGITGIFSKGVVKTSKGAGQTISGAMTPVADSTKKFSAKSVLKGAAAILIVSAALVVAAYAFTKFSEVSFGGFMAGIGALAALSGSMVVLSKLSGSILIGSAAMLVASGALLLSAVAFNMFAEMPFTGILKGIGAMLSVAGILAGISFIAPLVLAGAGTMAIAGLSLLAVAIPFAIISSIDADALGNSIKAIWDVAKTMALIGLISPAVVAGAYAVGVMGWAMIPAAAGLVLISSAIESLSSALSSVSPGAMVAGAGAFAISMGLMMPSILTIALLSPLIFLGALAIQSVAGSMVYLAIAGSMLQGVDMQPIFDSIIQISSHSAGIWSAAGGVFALAAALGALAAVSVGEGISRFFGGGIERILNPIIRLAFVGDRLEAGASSTAMMFDAIANVDRGEASKNIKVVSRSLRREFVPVIEELGENQSVLDRVSTIFGIGAATGGGQDNTLGVLEEIRDSLANQGIGQPIAIDNSINTGVTTMQMPEGSSRNNESTYQNIQSSFIRGSMV